MRHLALCVLLLLFSTMAFAAKCTGINYSISYITNTKTPRIKVDAEILGDFSGSTKLSLPLRWASGEYSKQIKNLVVTGHKYEKKENNLILKLPQNTSKIHLSYEISQKSGNPSDIAQTIIRGDMVQAPGYGLFVYPSAIPADCDVLFTIVWKNIPENWKYISSYGKSKELSFKTTVPNLLHAFYIAGDIRIYDLGAKRRQLFLSLNGNFDVNDKTIISVIKKVVYGQRKLFKDNNFPYYAISLTEDLDHDGTIKMGGTLLNNGFLFYMGQGVTREDVLKEVNYKVMLAHEHIHSWIGGKIKNNEQEELNYWWSEGFTEYYARITALRSNLISLQEFVQECNVMLRNYYLSPVLHIPNSRIKKMFWKDYDIQKLPYYRGFIFALYLNGIVKNKNSSFSLDDVIYEMLKAAQNQRFSEGLFKDIVNPYVGVNIDSELRKFINHGETIDLAVLSKFIPVEKVTYKSGKTGYQISDDLTYKNKNRLRRFFGL